MPILRVLMITGADVDGVETELEESQCVSEVHTHICQLEFHPQQLQIHLLVFTAPPRHCNPFSVMLPDILAS